MCLVFPSPLEEDGYWLRSFLPFGTRDERGTGEAEEDTCPFAKKRIPSDFQSRNAPRVLNHLTNLFISSLEKLKLAYSFPLSTLNK